MSATGDKEAAKQRLKDALLRMKPSKRALVGAKLRVKAYRSQLDPHNKRVLMKSGLSLNPETNRIEQDPDRATAAPVQCAVAPAQIELEPEHMAVSRVSRQIVAEQASKARLRAELASQQGASLHRSTDDIWDQLADRFLLWIRNPFWVRSEGLRRVSLVLSPIALVAWLCFVGGETNWFAMIGASSWAAMFAIPICAYLVIVALRVSIFWVIAGFRSDRRTGTNH